MSHCTKASPKENIKHVSLVNPFRAKYSHDFKIKVVEANKKRPCYITQRALAAQYGVDFATLTKWVTQDSRGLLSKESPKENVKYGLTSETVAFYNDAVRYGFSWELAMFSLRELYMHNKAFALSEELN